MRNDIIRGKIVIVIIQTHQQPWALWIIADDKIKKQNQNRTTEVL